MALDQTPIALTLAPTIWSPELAARLAQIADAAPLLPIWHGMVARGEASLMVLRADAATCGVMILRLEADGDRLGLIVNALQADPIPGVDLVDLMAGLCTQLGRDVGAQFLRFWTHRRGLAVKAAALGYDVRYVCEVDL